MTERLERGFCLEDNCCCTFFIAVQEISQLSLWAQVFPLKHIALLHVPFNRQKLQDSAVWTDTTARLLADKDGIKNFKTHCLIQSEQHIENKTHGLGRERLY